MLSDIENPGIFSQQLIPVDVIEDVQGLEISPFLNRYFLRSVHFDVIATKQSAYIYSKMCRVIIFGRIQEKRRKEWKGSQIKLRKGSIEPRDYHVPPGIFEYWNLKADEAKKALDSMSSRQQEKLSRYVEANIDRFSDSEVRRAIEYDIYHSGRKAFNGRDD